MDKFSIPNSDNQGKRHPKKKTEAQMFETNQRKGEVTKEMLRGMTVEQIRQAVRRHNLHYAIRGYSKLRKEELIEKFMFHYKNVVDLKANPKKPARGKSKLTQFDKTFGLDKPMYKEGVQIGATKDFKKKYGNMLNERRVQEKRDADFLKDLGKKLSKAQQQKRARKPTQKAVESKQQNAKKPKTRKGKRVRKKPTKMNL